MIYDKSRAQAFYPLFLFLFSSIFVVWKLFGENRYAINRVKRGFSNAFNRIYFIAAPIAFIKFKTMKGRRKFFSRQTTIKRKLNFSLVTLLRTQFYGKRVTGIGKRLKTKLQSIKKLTKALIVVLKFFNLNQFKDT